MSIEIWLCLKRGRDIGRTAVLSDVKAAFVYPRFKVLSNRRCCVIYSRDFFLTIGVEASGSLLPKHGLHPLPLPDCSRNLARTKLLRERRRRFSITSSSAPRWFPGDLITYSFCESFEHDSTEQSCMALSRVVCFLQQSLCASNYILNGPSIKHYCEISTETTNKSLITFISQSKIMRLHLNT